MQCFGSEGPQRGGGSCSTYILHTYMYIHPGHFFCRQNSFLMIQSCQETAFSVSFSCQLVNVMFCIQRGPSVEVGPHSCSSYILHIIIHTQNLFVCGHNSFLMIQSCQETVFSLSFSCQLVHLMFCVQRGPSVELRSEGPQRGAGSCCTYTRP